MSPRPTISVLRQRLWTAVRLRQLKLVVEVADHGSLSKAAVAMKLSQPAVSNGLLELERMLEAPIFIRHARGITATPLGLEVIACARRMLSDVDRIAEAAHALQGESRGLVKLGAIGGAIGGFLSAALPAFASRNPGLFVRVQEADPRAILALIASDEVDMALMRAPAELPSGWSFEPLMDDRFVVVAGPHHPLARLASITVEQLRQYPWRQAPTDSLALKAVEEVFGQAQPHGPSLDVSCRIPELMLAMLSKTEQVTLAPRSVVRQYLEAGLLVELGFVSRVRLGPVGLLRPDQWTNVDAAAVEAFFVAFSRSEQLLADAGGPRA